MKVLFKKLVPEAVKPKFGKPGDAGADLVATSLDSLGKTIHFHTNRYITYMKMQIVINSKIR